MKRHYLAATVLLAPIAGLAIAGAAHAAPLATFVSPSPSPSPTVTETTSPSPSPSDTGTPTEGVTADIRVELDIPDAERWGPMVFGVSGVPVNDDVELPAGQVIDNPSEWCGDVAVDIAADLSSVTVTGGENPCDFTEAYVRITLHGATWAELGEISGELFVPYDFEPGVFAQFSKVGGVGNGQLGSAVAFALLPLPTLQEASANGSVFEAYWLGTEGGYMEGSQTFAFGAPGAVPVEADPDFAG